VFSETAGPANLPRKVLLSDTRQPIRKKHECKNNNRPPGHFIDTGKNKLCLGYILKINYSESTVELSSIRLSDLDIGA